MGCRVEEKSRGSGPIYADIHLSGASSFVAIKECKFPLNDQSNQFEFQLRFSVSLSFPQSTTCSQPVPQVLVLSQVGHFWTDAFILCTVSSVSRVLAILTCGFSGLIVDHLKAIHCHQKPNPSLLVTPPRYVVI